MKYSVDLLFFGTQAVPSKATWAGFEMQKRFLAVLTPGG